MKVLFFPDLNELGRIVGRKAHPSDWKEILHQRDGTDSGASITLYRSRERNTYGTILNPAERRPVGIALPREPPVPCQMESNDIRLMDTGYYAERLLVVKRGDTANIAERERFPHFHQDGILQFEDGVTWQKIRHQASYVIHPPKNEGIESDKYADVNEYLGRYHVRGGHHHYGRRVVNWYT